MAEVEGGLGDWTRQLRKAPADTSETSVRDRVDAIDAVALDNEVPFAAAHARRYVASDGEDDGWEGPRPILILYTKGRRSGAVRRNPLLYVEHDGHRHVIGSKGGVDGHPSWYLNLRDEPRVHVRVMAEVYEADARTLDDDERAALWPHLVAGYPMFAEYQARTQRQIPVVLIDPI
jgi:deazaflavin-dependent oxidoreductase (nitroreductase family)